MMHSNMKRITIYPRPPLARRVLSSVIASGRPASYLSVCPSVHPERHSHSNSLMILGISPKFGGMMHSNMKQIAI